MFIICYGHTFLTCVGCDLCYYFHYLLLLITIPDASKSIEEVHQELVSIVTTTIDRVQTESSPLQRMWADGEYELPELNDEKKEN